MPASNAAVGAARRPALIERTITSENDLTLEGRLEQARRELDLALEQGDATQARWARVWGRSACSALQDYLPSTGHEEREGELDAREQSLDRREEELGERADKAERLAEKIADEPEELSATFGERFSALARRAGGLRS